MAAKTSDWRPGPSVCRCCFAEGCYKDISTEYFWMGKREVYSEMLTETFDVTIGYAQTGGPNSNSRLICEPCIARLRDASDFKRQVQECEKVFQQHLAQPSSSSLEFELPATSEKEEIKLELVKEEAKLDEDDDFDDQLGYPDDDDDDDMDDEPLTKLASKVPKQESDEMLRSLLMDDSRKLEKRKSSTKAKASPAKKAKKKESPKPSVSKPAKVVVEKKKKGILGQEQGSSKQVLVLKDDANAELEKSSKQAPIPKVTWKRKEKCKVFLGKTNVELKASEKSHVVKNKTTGSNLSMVLKKDVKTIANQENAGFILEHSNAIPFRNYRGKFMCAYCDFLCPTIEQLRTHSNTHEKLTNLFKRTTKFPLRIEITDLACNICNLKVNSVDNLKSHLEHNHSKKPPSEEDENGSIAPFILTQNEFKCVHCDETFITFGYLLLHTNKHYQNCVCHVCGKGFRTNRNLKQHKMVHDEKSCECSKCGEVLPTRAARIQHIAAVHGPKYRYKCPMCDAAFISYHMRLKHLDKEHGQKSEYPCVQCSEVFTTSLYRSSHIRTVHQKERKKKPKNPTE